MDLFNDFISLFYPRTCFACGNTLFRNEEVICTYCLLHLPETGFHREDDNPLKRLFYGRVRLYSAAAFYYYRKGGKVQHLIHNLKYSGHTEIGIFLGKIYGNELKRSKLFNTIEVIMPIPLHRDKLRKRGFNQSEIFAAGIAESMDIPLDTTTLYRNVNTPTQTKKSQYKRWKNVSEVFKLRSEEKLTGKHILLVDDVITTGSTMEACINTLYSVPEIKISVAAIGFPVH